jgi:hypothetical protein
MSIVGETTGALGALTKFWSLLRDRLDPARAQAKRLIETMEAYGVARQQIPRILPPELKLPIATFSTPDKLKDKLTPELLDWTAEYLSISRSWLDNIAETPHLVVDYYKAPAGYGNWLAARLEVAPHTTRFLSVWKPQGQPIWPNGFGPVCLIYEEVSDGLDGTEFARYWLLSNFWRLEHAPCIENLLAVIAVARSVGVQILGYEVPMRTLHQLEAGKKLIPVVRQSQRAKWHPEDLIDPLPGQDSEWRRSLWRGAQGYLAGSEFDMVKKRSPV